MRESFYPVALSFGVVGVLTLARQPIELTEPAYYDPVTGLDFAAAWLTSIAGEGGMTAFALLLWWRRTPIRRGSRLPLIAAFAFALSAVGNVLGDVFDLAVGDDLYFAGAVGFGATVPTHNRLGGMMWAVWHASCQTARTPVELIQSAGRFPFRVAVVDATVFTRNEWKERHCSGSYPQPLRSGWGLTRSTG